MMKPYLVKLDEPSAALSDVLYEVQMLIETASCPAKDKLLHDALLESRLLHTRNLIDFFKTQRSSYRSGCIGRTENDDVLAKDFYPEPSAAPKLSDDDKKKLDLVRLNKSLAHITYTRTELRSKEWPLETSLFPLLKPCRGFLEYLQDSFWSDTDGRHPPHRDQVLRLLQGIDNLERTSRATPDLGPTGATGP